MSPPVIRSISRKMEGGRRLPEGSAGNGLPRGGVTRRGNASRRNLRRERRERPPSSDGGARSAIRAGGYGKLWYLIGNLVGTA